MLLPLSLPRLVYLGQHAQPVLECCCDCTSVIHFRLQHPQTDCSLHSNCQVSCQAHQDTTHYQAFIRLCKVTLGLWELTAATCQLALLNADPQAVCSSTPPPQQLSSPPELTAGKQRSVLDYCKSVQGGNAMTTTLLNALSSASCCCLPFHWGQLSSQLSSFKRS